MDNFLQNDTSNEINFIKTYPVVAQIQHLEIRRYPSYFTHINFKNLNFRRLTSLKLLARL